MRQGPQHQAHQDHDDPSRSNGQTLLYCIGAQKAGTTWLQAQLEEHPSAFFAAPKETHYWDCIRAPYITEFQHRIAPRFKIPGPNASLRYRLSRLWHPEIRVQQELASRYQRMFEGGIFDHSQYLDYLGQNQKAHRIIGDFTPEYALLGKDTFKEMLQCHTDVKFIFIMRDPVSRLWSGIQQRYINKIRRNKVTSDDICRVFVQALENCNHTDFLMSNYARTIAELEAAVPPERIHYAFFENLLDIKEGMNARSDLISFIGLANAELDPGIKVHVSAKSFSLPQALAEDARHALGQVYEHVSDRFDSHLHAAWRH